MTALTHLSLGHNLLNGPIPESFGHLNDLSYMDLSAYQLSGVLPNSIHKLSNLKVNIRGHIPPSSPEYEADEDDSEYTRWLYVSFSTSFWWIIGTLMLNRRWRQAYFLFLCDLLPPSQIR
ncbi:hypothetical protein ACET3Z_004512 [Daucus carota]